MADKMYDPKKIEPKWQKKWSSSKFGQASNTSDEQKHYVLDMFPYPSGDGLHMGHVENFVATDIYSRYQLMRGLNVMHPMGWDAFGLPAENFAIKTGIHPSKKTLVSIKNFKKQMATLGLAHDWKREINTSSPEYYKWTQWFFLLLYKNGLAYKAKAKVNWCNSCKTVLANEQVVDGRCERCKNEVELRDLEQWFFKITDYAEALINDLDGVDWPESTKIAQRNWIGKSEGALINFELTGIPGQADGKHQVEVFTTRPDTLFGATFLAISPELAEKWLSVGWQAPQEVKDYIKATQAARVDQGFEEKEKTGIDTGIMAINPANKEEIPVWVVNYVLGDVGTGAIMAVPAHDERDHEFATKFNLPIKDITPEPDKQEMTKRVGGRWTKRYKLRDWLISRQRYWGAPIPIIYCDSCGEQPVPEKDLPVKLPTDVDFRPTGESPLVRSKSFHKVKCPKCGVPARRESDTMDTFVCSSWYYYRFTDPANKKVFADKKQLEEWLPVDVYMGGAEHTVLHLMYARFFTKVLEKLGYVNFGEPFTKLRHQGIVLGEDGSKMSKSVGNVVNPDGVIKLYGADTARMYTMFMGPLEDMKPWNSQNIIGTRRFLERVWRLQFKVAKPKALVPVNGELELALHRTIKKVGEDIETFGLNTAISAMMILVNEMDKLDVIPQTQYAELIKLLAPFAPHITEEIWSNLGHKKSVHLEEWPTYSEAKIKAATVKLVVQISGKVRDTLTVPAGLSMEEATRLAKESPIVAKWLSGVEARKVIHIPDRLINLVL
jgi:leucyl-tRNA synthetase